MEKNDRLVRWLRRGRRREVEEMLREEECGDVRVCSVAIAHESGEVYRVDALVVAATTNDTDFIAFVAGAFPRVPSPHSLCSFLLCSPQFLLPPVHPSTLQMMITRGWVRSAADLFVGLYAFEELLRRDRAYAKEVVMVLIRGGLFRFDVEAISWSDTPFVNFFCKVSAVLYDLVRDETLDRATLALFPPSLNKSFVTRDDETITDDLNREAPFQYCFEREYRQRIALSTRHYYHYHRIRHAHAVATLFLSSFKFVENNNNCVEHEYEYEDITYDEPLVLYTLRRKNIAYVERMLRSGVIRYLPRVRYMHSAFNNVAVTRLLLEYDADANERCNTPMHETPLQRAVRECAATKGATFDYCQLLVEYGADVQVRNDMNQNLLHVAVLYGTHHKLIQLLVERGVDANHCDARGRTPADYTRSDKVARLLKI